MHTNTPLTRAAEPCEGPAWLPEVTNLSGILHRVRAALSQRMHGQHAHEQDIKAVFRLCPPHAHACFARLAMLTVLRTLHT